jgi:hypothetical protein
MYSFDIALCTYRTNCDMSEADLNDVMFLKVKY